MYAHSSRMHTADIGKVSALRREEGVGREGEGERDSKRCGRS